MIAASVRSANASNDMLENLLVIALLKIVLEKNVRSALSVKLIFELTIG